MVERLGTLVNDATGLRHACVIDQDADTGVLSQTSFQRSEVGGLCQVGLKHLHGHAVFLAQLCSQCFQARVVARHQHQVMATAGEALGIGSTDAGGGASDQNSGERSHDEYPKECRSDGKCANDYD